MAPMTPREDRIEINHEFSSLDHFIQEYVSNISTSGVFLRSKDPLPVGTRVNLRFTVIMDEPEILEGVGEVTRVSKRPRGMGVIFVELTAHSEELIKRLIVKRMVGGGWNPAPSRSSRAKTLPPPAPTPARGLGARARRQTLPPPPPPKKSRKPK